MAGSPYKTDVRELISFCDDDRLHEECGVFGALTCGSCDASDRVFLGLFALQHRGQESAGIAAWDGVHIQLHKAMGLVSRVFGEAMPAALKGNAAIGHVRYSTTGSSSISNAQPIAARCAGGMLAVAHNGNLTNADDLRDSLAKTGSVFQSTSDTEVVLNLIARYSTMPFERALFVALNQLEGSFSLVVLHEGSIYAVRDRHGNRPLVIGTIEGAPVVASETCAITSLGGSVDREVRPGEMVTLSPDGVQSTQLLQEGRRALCAMEYVYFSRPDSLLSGRLVHHARKEMGRELARTFPVEADLVVPVPESGFSTAIGFAEESGIPLDIALVVNRYVGRTFIRPEQDQRHRGVNLKLHPMKEVLQGKRVIIIDDSIVRGTTSRMLVHTLREAGAVEVHMYVSSPPLRFPCFYGIDISASRELIAATQTPEQICACIGADSLHYQAVDGLRRAIGVQDGLCLACFTGEYPMAAPSEGYGKFTLEGVSR